MSADSRMTLSSERQVDPSLREVISITSSNSSQKITILNNQFGLSFRGDAAINNQPIMGYVVKFEQEGLNDQLEVDQILYLILDYFRQISQNSMLTFHFTGYKPTKYQSML
jgi:hypothetical protein